MTQALDWLAGVDWAGPGPRAVLLGLLFLAVSALAWVLIQMDKEVRLPRQPKGCSARRTGRGKIASI